MKKINHDHLDYFNPKIITSKEACQNFSRKILAFDAGAEFKSFNDFIKSGTEAYADSGDGITYTVWNIFYGVDGEEKDRELVAYYTLATTAIPYEDRIRNDEIEGKETGQKYDSQPCGIPSIEIKLFAVDQKYQDVFYKYGGYDFPISAWILRNIINHIVNIQMNTVAFKAIFLHAVPDAVEFYLQNGFSLIEEYMHPFYDIDSDMQAMYLTLKPVIINFET